MFGESFRKIVKCFSMRRNSISKTKPKVAISSSTQIPRIQSTELQKSEVISTISRPILISDVLELILENITEQKDQYDIYNLMAYLNLFNCLLVDKRWCSCVIPILYRQFRHYRNGSYRNSELIYDRSKLIRLYLSLLNLNESERKYLESRKICLPPPNNNPCFNYPQYIKQLDYGRFVQAVGNYYQNFATGTKRESFCEDKISVLIRILLRLFEKSGGKITWLNFSHAGDFFRTRYFGVFVDACESRWVNNVMQLEIDSERSSDGHLFPRLPHGMNNLGFTNLDTLLSTLSSISSLQFQDYSRHFEVVLSAIQSQRKSLRKLVFVHCNFRGCEPFHAIAECENLQVLEFLNCENISEEMVKPLWIKNNMVSLKKVVVSIKEGDGGYISTRLISWAEILENGVKVDMIYVYDLRQWEFRGLMV
ncbi:hypothetical protein G9A89_001551 [Geosiphon pyriformis]|nr:hypothetical protein G9A89_001551 [Geosiphon pyriformis]